MGPCLHLGIFSSVHVYQTTIFDSLSMANNMWFMNTYQKKRSSKAEGKDKGTGQITVVDCCRVCLPHGVQNRQCLQPKKERVFVNKNSNLTDNYLGNEVNINYFVLFSLLIPPFKYQISPGKMVVKSFHTKCK